MIVDQVNVDNPYNGIVYDAEEHYKWDLPIMSTSVTATSTGSVLTINSNCVEWKSEGITISTGAAGVEMLTGCLTSSFKEKVMKKRGRYLVKEVQEAPVEGKTPTLVSPSIREWECVEVGEEYYKVVDLVEYEKVTSNNSVFGAAYHTTTKEPGKPFWLSYDDMDRYEILEELD